MGTLLRRPMGTRGTLYPATGTPLRSITGTMTTVTGTTRATATVATVTALDTLITAMALVVMRVGAVVIAVGLAIVVTLDTAAMRAFEAIAFRITVSGAWVELAALGLEVVGALDVAKISPSTIRTGSV